ncbi:MAG: type I-E CRISPR-associated protein Cas6/Cse3/CasE [Elusimicrobia bacterium]|nr:type I-E CRISPR-associated protein Cas6/Cse3/CasE [Elusimicrobiota bacterium]
MSWLARLEINAGIARMENISDNYVWHKKLWQCLPGLPDNERDKIGFLTRIDTFEKTFRLWVLSKIKPARPQWCPPADFALKEIADGFLSHRYYAFDLRANPTKRDIQQGKRVPLIKEEELRSWLIRKGKVRRRDKDTGLDVAGGFRIVEDKPLEIRRMVENYFRKMDKKNGKKYAAYHGGVQFRGILEVTDPVKFRETYHAGIGSAKGFGFGLFLLAPIEL